MIWIKFKAINKDFARGGQVLFYKIYYHWNTLYFISIKQACKDYGHWAPFYKKKTVKEEQEKNLPPMTADQNIVVLTARFTIAGQSD